jgi:hypothetical protein
VVAATGRFTPVGRKRLTVTRRFKLKQ